MERGRLELERDTAEWLSLALDGSGVELYELSPAVAVASTTLPGSFHRDPGDQIIVATAREIGCPLLTCDDKLLAYPHVETVG